jgi:hypothetical protein
MKLDAIVVHEAAHALVAHLLGGTVDGCEVFSSGGGTHSARHVPYRKRLHLKFAGHVGVRVALGAAAANPAMAESDVKKACSIACRLTHNDEARAEALLLAAENEVEALLTANLPALRALAGRLQQDGKLDDQTVRDVVAGAA